MDFYTFGFNGHCQLQLRLQDKDNEHNKHTPTLVFDASIHDLQILWASWCDTIVAWKYVQHDLSKMVYAGSGLTTAQTAYLECLQNNSNQYAHLEFFGAELGEGLQGILDTKKRTVTLFTPDSDLFTTYIAPDGIHIHHIALTSGGHVSLTASHARYTGSSIASFPSVEAFQSWLAQDISAPSPSILQTFPAAAWKQLVSNATTTTALTTTGQVYTWTHDPRYPRLLGRPVDSDTPASVPHPIEYLSETTIVEIASGGYMSAAVSKEGELFIWGQSCPGTTDSLNIFKPGDDEDADLCVKCIELKIDNQEAKAKHVAIGSGHVLVAAEMVESGTSSVFAAGQGECGQLGLGGTPEFVEEFTEVKILSGKKVAQLRASGWSTWIVAEHKN